MLIELNLSSVYKPISGSTAKLEDIDKYLEAAINLAGEGNEVTLTGPAPIWLYLKIAHALHGKTRKLFYSAPGQGIEKFEIFSHDPF